MKSEYNSTVIDNTTLNSKIAYFADIDLSILSPHIIKGLYQDMSGYENELILNLQCSYKIEQIIKSSTPTQLSIFITKLKKKRLIRTKLGSRVLQTLFSKLENVEYKVLTKVNTFIIKNIVEYITQPNSTFAVREYFKIINKIKLKEKNKINSIDNEKIKEIIKKLKDKKSDIIFTIEEDKAYSEAVLLTILEYIKVVKSSKLTKKIINKYSSRITTPSMSYFFEYLIETMSKKNLELFFNTIKENIPQLSIDTYANYVISKLIKYYKTEEYIKILNIKQINHNILYNLLESNIKQKKIKEVENIIKKRFNPIENMIFKKENDTIENKDIDSKYAKILYKYFYYSTRDKEKEKQSVINMDRIISRFLPEWLFKKSGSLLVMSFLLSDSKEKEAFIIKNRRYFKRMVNYKCGIEILKNMKSYCNNELRKEIEHCLNRKIRK